MFNPAISLLASSATHSAHKPFHVIILVSVIACFAYLSVLDEYVPEFSTPSAVSYYYPGIKDHDQSALLKESKWSIIDNSTFPRDATHYALLTFRLVGQKDDEEFINADISGSFAGDSPYERKLVVPYNQIDEVVPTLSEIKPKNKESQTVWKLRPYRNTLHWKERILLVWNRLQNAINRADTFDIVLVSSAYVLMTYTFGALYFNMKKLGSNFWLTFATVLSSFFALLFALVTAKKFDIHVSLRSLSEGLPFFVATIGFNSKIQLTKQVFKKSRDNQRLIISPIINEVVREDAFSILRDYVVEFGAFYLCYAVIATDSNLSKFCFVCATLLAYDALLLFSFFSAVLALKFEIGKINQNLFIKEALEADGISEAVATSVANDSMSLKEMNQDSDLRLINNGDSWAKISIFKFLMAGGFVLLNVFSLSIFIPSLSESPSVQFVNDNALSKEIARHVPLGPNGTVLTVRPALLYKPLEITVEFEDAIYKVLRKVSAGIRDPYLSKVLIVFFFVSLSLNAYLLSVAREADNVEVHKTKKTENKPVDPVAVNAVTSNSTSPKELLTQDVADYSVDPTKPRRPLEECISVLKQGKAKELGNEEVLDLVTNGKLPLYALEKQLQDTTRAVAIRRLAIAETGNIPVLKQNKLPFLHYDYDRVFGACCENVIGYMPLPVGIAGPIIIDDKQYFIPMATTEGCLVASTMRGCKAINAGGGAVTVLTQDGMTRGPCVSFPTLKRAGEAKIWLDSQEGQDRMKGAFNSTSRFARLQHVKTAIAGTLLFIRFKTTTGDAMGMNMISKGVEFALGRMVEDFGFEDMEVISVSGNYCTDKKPAAINWIEGRGKSVVAEAIIPGEIVRRVLKSDVDALVQLNISKNLIGSAMAGSVGGFNAQAANLVTAIYLACGQDPAQNVESSNCITLMKNVDGNLQISVSMPSIEVGTIGGGTVLDAQGSMLELLGVRGPHPTHPGTNARQLAKIVAAGVLAAELSLCSALAAGHLVQSHMQHNRSKAPTPAAATPVSGRSEVDLQRLRQGAQICIKS